ncbi:MAG: cell division protein SepF [Lachnospiraceae bacterium]|nr:cell division protein SepF [Lachnospiraceae bacterium]
MGRLIRSLLDSLKLTDEDDEYEDEDFDIIMDNSRKREVVPKRENPPLRKYEEQNNADFEEEEEEDDEPLAQRRTFNARPSAPTGTSARPTQNERGFSFGQSRTGTQRTFQTQRTTPQPQTKTAVPLRSSLSDRRIYVLNPKSFEDAREVCDTIKAGGVIFMNFEGVKYELAQRLMDYAGGAVYAVNGQIYQISGYNFIAAPGDTDIEGDILAQITSAGNEFPTFSKY